MEHVKEDSRTAEILKGIEAGLEMKYLGEIQRLTDGLHEIKDALTGSYFSEQAQSDLVDSLVKEYIREGAAKLLAGQKIDPVVVYLGKIGIEVVRFDAEKLEAHR